MWETLMMLSMLFTASFLIVLVLIQRGKGGGLAGALGGMGGQSAFGTKAGDTFTKITIGVATLWIILCMVAVGTLAKTESKMNLTGSGLTASPPAGEEGASPAPTGGAEGTAPAGESE